MPRTLIFVSLMLTAVPAAGQEQVDKADPRKAGSAAVAKMAVRVRVASVAPEMKAVTVSWRRGGEGLGGDVTRGAFASADGKPEIAVGEWSAPLPLETVVGRVRGWEFPTVVAAAPAVGKKRGPEVTSMAVEFEFTRDGKPLKAFTEPSPKGATVGFAFPGGLLAEKGPDAPEFLAALQGLSGHARARRGRLEALFPEPSPMPARFAVIGHLGGFGEAGGVGKGAGSGYGVRHCNPEIVADECRTLRLLGVNGLVGSLRLVEAAGTAAQFRRIYWGGPGSGSPMGFFTRGKQMLDGCPFDPALKAAMAERTTAAIAEHRAAGAKESWALWWDEIGVAAKEHHQKCPRCRDEFRAYLRSQGVTPADVGAGSWDEVAVYPIWDPPAPPPAKGRAPRPARGGLAERPATAADALRYYHSFRFMTVATAKLFPESAAAFKAAGIPLYAMQGPTPSWSGSSLDWHEFYDLGANTAFVWETSNRDPRVWQWESYLGDIGRGIAGRHGMPIGVLIKPHRGAPEQRMLSVVARGATVIEWYTYGPDYSKGDSFSQSPELLERVARAGRFLGRAEDLLYGAKPAVPAEVALVSPRSSEIWGKVREPGAAAFEDAKWIHTALMHAHVPTDVISEQQLAEGKLDRYKVIYVVGPNLRRDAAAKLTDWVRAGGTLWTDALGLSRDEADQPAAALSEVVPAAGRKLEGWGSVAGYRATGLTPLTETAVPEAAGVSWDAGGAWGRGTARAAIAREPLPADGADVIAKFADGRPAVIRRAVGKGEVIVAGLWAGLTYSAKVRRPDYDMRADFDPAVRTLIAAPAIARGAARPATASDALTEMVLLDNAGRRCVALINWAYRADPAGGRPRNVSPVENLRVSLGGAGDFKTVRSLLHGPLPVVGDGPARTVTLPRLEEIDLLILE